MVWYNPMTWSERDPQAELDAIETEQKALDAKREAVKAKMSATQQGEALSGPSPPAMGGRRRNKKTRRAKKGKSRKASK